MTFLITRGYTGDQSDVILRGYGEQVVVITQDLDKVQGASVLEGFYSKRRVKGLTLESEDNLVLIDDITAFTQHPTKIFKMLKTNKKERLLITKAVDAMRDDPMHITSIVIRRPSKDLTIKTNYIRKQLNRLDVQGDKLISFVEKQIKIKNIETKLTSKKTKHLNVMDTLDTIEVAELMDIIKDLEDSDV